MALTRTQQLAYKSTCNIYRRIETTVDGVRGNGVWTLILAAVPCLYDYTQNDSEPVNIGRVGSRNALTEDKIELEVGLSIRDQDMIIDTTPGPNFGLVHRIQGQATRLENQGRRITNCQMLQLFADEHPPPEIVP